jgi:hypothetical protein
LRTGGRFSGDLLAITVSSSAKGPVSKVSSEKIGFVFLVFCDI